MLNDFFVIVLSLLVEGIPFILMGSLLSGFVHVYISRETVVSFIQSMKSGARVAMNFLGMVFPVCECGNIPFARQLIRKGISPTLSITFLLSAPVINPIVIIATLAAFPNDPQIVLWRVVFTFIVATAVGAAMELLPQDQIVLAGADTPISSCHHNKKSLLHTLHHVRGEFLEMMGIFTFGSMIATSIQMFIPRDFVLLFNEHAWVSILVMMLLGFIISICSNVDAFFALAYSQIFPESALLAFLVFGPMIDIKAIAMLRTTYTWKTIFTMSSLCLLFTFLLTYIYYLV